MMLSSSRFLCISLTVLWCLRRGAEFTGSFSLAVGQSSCSAGCASGNDPVKLRLQGCPWGCRPWVLRPGLGPKYSLHWTPNRPDPCDCPAPQDHNA
jgi:hypothetical protein